MANLQDLPEECIAKILSHTTPVDACRLSLVSKTFRSASEYDIVWDRFLPSDSSSIISLSSSNSKKALYFTLPDFRPTIIDNGNKSFQLDKRTAKKCYMISARDLTFSCRFGEWGRASARLQESRFKNVVWLPCESFFSIDWTINTGILSPNTKYTVFLVFKLIKSIYEFNTRRTLQSLSPEKSSIYPLKTTLKSLSNEYPLKKLSKVRFPCIQANSKSYSYTEVVFVGGIGSGCTSATDHLVKRPIERRDGWLEIKIGSFNSGLKEDQVPLKVRSIRDIWNRCGFIIEGIEFRPRC